MVEEPKDEPKKQDDVPETQPAGGVGTEAARVPA